MVNSSYTNPLLNLEKRYHVSTGHSIITGLFHIYNPSTLALALRGFCKYILMEYSTFILWYPRKLSYLQELQNKLLNASLSMSCVLHTLQFFFFLTPSPLSVGNDKESCNEYQRIIMQKFVVKVISKVTIS